MQHNISLETKRRLALCLTAYPCHSNRRRRRIEFQENTVLGGILLLSILLGLAAILLTA